MATPRKTKRPIRRPRPNPRDDRRTAARTSGPRKERGDAYKRAKAWLDALLSRGERYMVPCITGRPPAGQSADTSSTARME